MAQIPVRMNTQQMAFPLLSQQTGRTVINGQGDLTYVPGVSTDGDAPEDRGIPGVMYAHNVMPSTYGWQSIGFVAEIAAPVANAEFRQIEIVQGATVEVDALPKASSLRTYVAAVVIDAGTDSVLYYVDGTNNWVPISNSPSFPRQYEISVAYVNGYTYISVPFTGLYVFDIDAGLLRTRALDGINISTVEGVFASNGYLLLWTSRRVVWSSVVDVEDFVPSDVSGAGGGAIQEASGAIVYCTSSQLGFMVFTDNNVVSGVYTANEDFPFEFKEIPSAGGIYSQKLVSDSAAAGYYYAYTTNGIQRLSTTNSRSMLTNVSDFIGGNLFEDFNDSTGSLEQRQITEQMARSITVIGNRYIIVSYAETPGIMFTHAIVVDALQNRMGKLKTTHTDVFEYRSLAAGTSLDSRATIAFLDPSGECRRVDFDLNSQDANAVMLMGKIQFVHQRLLQLQELELENVNPNGNFSAVDYPSLDGKTFEPVVQGYENPDDVGKTMKRYLFSNTAKSHSLLFKGSFELLSILVWFNVHGRY
jgi:hypothetical protein